MKNKVLALGAVICVFFLLSSLKIKIPQFVPKIKKETIVPDWSQDTTISKPKLKYLNRVYESSNY